MTWAWSIWAARPEPVYGVWYTLWQPISWPASTVRRPISGHAITQTPGRKNVARTPKLARVRSTDSVLYGDGPSSNVNAIRRPGTSTCVTN